MCRLNSPFHTIYSRFPTLSQEGKQTLNPGSDQVMLRQMIKIHLYWEHTAKSVSEPFVPAMTLWNHTSDFKLVPSLFISILLSHVVLHMVMCSTPWR